MGFKNENLGSERWFSLILSSKRGGFCELATKFAVFWITAGVIQVSYILCFWWRTDGPLISGGGRIMPLAKRVKLLMA